jgi:hypothetical protein
MNAAPHNASAAMPPGMINSIAEAICARPHDTAAQRAARFSMVTATVHGLQPGDAMEVMLAGMAVTHAYLIEDAARDVFRGQDERLKARTRSAIVALDRGMVGFLKELREVQAGRRKAEVAAKPEPEAVTSLDAAPAPDRPLDGAKACPAKPMAGNAPGVAPIGTQVRATPRMPPETLLPPLRRAETSVAAAMAVLSPPVPPYAVSAAPEKSVAAPPAAVHARLTAPAALAEQPRTTDPKVSALEAASNAERCPTAEAALAA